MRSRRVRPRSWPTILEGMQGKLVISSSDKSVTYANPLHAVKLFQDYMLKAKEQELRADELKKKEKGSGGGIRIVLPSPVVDPGAAESSHSPTCETAESQVRTAHRR